MKRFIVTLKGKGEAALSIVSNAAFKLGKYMKIEDYRSEDIGNILIIVKNKGQVLCSFSDFIRQGYTDTTVMLQTFENPYNEFIVKNEIRYVSLVSIWFLTIEAYINSILKVLCLIKNENYEEQKKLDLTHKIKNIFKFAGADIKGLYKCGLFNQFREFLTFRNSIFHDRFNYKESEFKHTMFSGNPVYCNMIDVFQAIKIAMGIFETFRYVLPGYDLMPNVVPIVTNTGIDLWYFEKIEKIYHELFVPYFKSILAKHMMDTDFEFQYQYYRVPETNIVDKQDIQIIIKAIPHIDDVHLNMDKTNLYNYYLNELTKEVYIPKDEFSLPNYKR